MLASSVLRALPFVPLVACGGVAASNAGDGDSGAVADSNMASADADAADADVCNDVANTAPVVEEQSVVDGTPAPTGGTIADGTYYLTQALDYTGAAGSTGPDGITYQGTIVIAGGTFQEATAVTGGDAGPLFGGARNGTMTTNATSITLAFTCGAPDAGASFMYTATPTSVTFYARDQFGLPHVLVFTKQ